MSKFSRSLVADRAANFDKADTAVKLEAGRDERLVIVLARTSTGTVATCVDMPATQRNVSPDRRGPSDPSRPREIWHYPPRQAEPHDFPCLESIWGDTFDCFALHLIADLDMESSAYINVGRANIAIRSGPRL